MKVTFTCEKCGFTEGMSLGDVPYDGTFRSMPIPPHICLPQRSAHQLTYGRLTEEMVAEALRQAHEHNPLDAPVYSAMARFVLRLFRHYFALEPSMQMMMEGDPREVLLELAEEP